MATEDPAALLFPIGHCIGERYPTAASTDHFFQVRVGADVVRLNDEQFALWGVAARSEGLAEVARETVAPEPAETPPANMLTVLLGAIRTLIAHRTVYLDLVGPDGTAAGPDGTAAGATAAPFSAAGTS